jgi:SAM-dependent methyltransferase
MEHAYIHGTDPSEQARLAGLNTLTNEAFLDFLALRASDATLEVGSGLGILTHAVAQRLPRGAAWGVEQSPAQLARAPQGVPNLHFVQGDAHQLPFEADRFDVVYCRYLLEHVADPGQVLKEMRRVVKPGGRVLAQENNILVNVFEPACPTFDRVWQQFVRLQDQLGGDALVGKKLLGLYHHAGFARVELSVQPEVHYQGVPSFGPWVMNLMHNVTGAAEALQARGLATAAEIAAAVAELQALIAHPDGSAFFYWNRACGWK